MITICYSGNKRIFEGILLSAISVLQHTNSPIEFIILTMDYREKNALYEPIDEHQTAALEEVAKRYHRENTVRLADVSRLYRSDILQGKNNNVGYTPYCMLRLLLDKIEDIPDKLIYLDADTMATGDVKELYEIDVEGKEYAAVRDYMGRAFISPNYVNSGVLLLNMRLIRRTGLFGKARGMILTRKMIMADQTALNKKAIAKSYLPRRFNEQRKIKSNTVIKHFCKGIHFYPLFFYIYNIKQWEREAVRKKLKIKCFEDVYLEYDQLAAKHNLRSFASYATRTKKHRAADLSVSTLME